MRHNLKNGDKVFWFIEFSSDGFYPLFKSCSANP